MSGSVLWMIGASLSEPHTYAKYGDFVCLYNIYYIDPLHVTSFDAVNFLSAMLEDKLTVT